MIRVLIYHLPGKTTYWVADSDEKLEAAMFQLFKQMDTDGWFNNTRLNVTHGMIYEAAKTGDPKWVHRILAQYEGNCHGWEVVMAIDPGAASETA